MQEVNQRKSLAMKKWVREKTEENKQDYNEAGLDKKGGNKG